MSIRELAKPSVYKTASELRAIVGKPTPICQCGNPFLAVLHSGEIACPDCRSELNACRSPLVAISICVVPIVNGVDVAMEVPRGSSKWQAKLDLAANFGLAPGFRIVAVAGPLWPIEPDVAYSPDASQAERAAALEMFQWDRVVRAREVKNKDRLDGRQGDDTGGQGPGASGRQRPNNEPTRPTPAASTTGRLYG